MKLINAAKESSKRKNENVLSNLKNKKKNVKK